MLAMADDLGFKIMPDVHDPQVMRVDCDLTKARAPSLAAPA